MIEQAFYALVSETDKPYYVVLWEARQYYGGPEEGGWYGYDYIVASYKRVDSLLVAENLAARIHLLAKNMSKQSRDEYYRRCLEECERADAAGEDPTDYYGGDVYESPSSFYVTVEEEMPESHFGNRYYS